MGYNGVASANIESLRGVGHILVDNSLDNARVVGVGDHRTEAIYTTREKRPVCGKPIARQPRHNDAQEADVVGSKNKV